MKVLPDMVGMVVEDMKRSLDFYRALGLDIPQELDTEGHAEIKTENGYRLAWDTIDVIKSFNPRWKKQPGQGVSLAFLVDSPAGVDELYTKLTELGYQAEKEPWDAFWGQRYAVVTDPDGYNVDLFALL